MPCLQDNLIILYVFFRLQVTPETRFTGPIVSPLNLVLLGQDGLATELSQEIRVSVILRFLLFTIKSKFDRKRLLKTLWEKEKMLVPYERPKSSFELY